MKIISRLALPAASICLLLLLAACGAKGPLFLPEEPAQAEDVDAADAPALPTATGLDGQSSDAASNDSLPAVPEVDVDGEASDTPDGLLPDAAGEPAPADESGND
ncbi:LPS translocon maturation chaperone LptM [Pseudoxanthomonas dokdonensis]|uniref:Sugar transporter n=1 Tax=Pseudoxanthomonas dokdonensis TaxID=344882 RepID=A0A0R0CLG2_9GAMM|nr:lipoprotein [Pseudoxanthomonas dokdonensis]KRG70395.1 hypothetical protein ABB29_06465 [Pseudoxanthomonas dokdonensis]